jgi:hypothetical protein
MKTVAERKKEIEFLMGYAVPEAQAEAAAVLLEKYGADVIGLNLLHSFYLRLPEGSEDSVSGLRLVARRQGVFLLCVLTGNAMQYLYLVNWEGAHILGTPAEGIVEREFLDFFGFADSGAVAALTGKPESLEEYEPYSADSELCPSCHAAEGEYHTLGCPVEICPWCKGQLTYCNCRFIKLGTDSMERETEVDRLLELLEEAGRIVFRKKDSPAYPGTDD